MRLKGALRLTALWISQSALARALSKSGGGDALFKHVRLAGESHVLEERIVEDIARLLGHWGSEADVPGKMRQAENQPLVQSRNCVNKIIQ